MGMLGLLVILLAVTGCPAFLHAPRNCLACRSARVRRVKALVYAVNQTGAASPTPRTLTVTGESLQMVPTVFEAVDYALRPLVAAVEGLKGEMREFKGELKEIKGEVRQLGDRVGKLETASVQQKEATDSLRITIAIAVAVLGLLFEDDIKAFFSPR